MKKLRNIQLIKQARSRDPDAFTQLIRMYMQDMYKVAIAILKHDEMQLTQFRILSLSAGKNWIL